MNFDKSEEAIAEKAKFLAWLNKHVPLQYRKQQETEECFSPVRHYETIGDIGFREKRSNLKRANENLSKTLLHIIGDDNLPCERCLRIVNARAVYIARHHPELFTEGANKLVWLELLQRNKEHKAEIEGDYKGDGLYLLRIIVPDIATNIHESHLAFYSENSIWQGVAALQERVLEHHRLLTEYPGLAQLVRFGEPYLSRFPETEHDFYYVSAYEHIPQHKGYKVTAVDIVSRKKD